MKWFQPGDHAGEVFNEGRGLYIRRRPVSLETVFTLSKIALREALGIAEDEPGNTYFPPHLLGALRGFVATRYMETQSPHASESAVRADKAVRQLLVREVAAEQKGRLAPYETPSQTAEEIVTALEVRLRQSLGQGQATGHAL